MLSAIFSSIGMSVINAVLGNFLEAFKAYENKVISVEQLKDQLYAALAAAVRDVEVAQADALAKTYASFMGAVVQSKLMQQVWAGVTISQTFVLVYHQLAIPLIVISVRYFVDNSNWQYPSSGSTVEWAYLLVAACVGMGPVVMRAGPGVGSMTERLKAMITK